MATTKIDGRRQPYQALEKYPDAAFLTDDLPLYFGTDGDTKFKYDAADGVLEVSGADIRFSDTVKLIFGDDNDASLSWDGAELDLTGVKLNYTSGDIQLSDTAELQLGNASDCRITHDGTNTTIKNATGKIIVSGAGGDIELSDTVQFQLGDQSDFRIFHDATNTQVVVNTGQLKFSGGDLLISDTQKLFFGDSGAVDASITWDTAKLAITGEANYSGGDLTFSDTAMLTFGSSTVASSDQHLYHYAKAGSDCLVIAGLTGRRVKTGCVFVSDGFLKIVT